MIRFESFSYAYPDAPQPVLRNVSLHIAPGELALVAGPSGGGKSTLLRCLNGLVPHFAGGVVSGSLRVAGLSPVAEGPQVLSRVVGFVFQDPEAQFVVDRVEDEIAFALENLAVPRAQMQAQVARALDLVGLTALRDRALGSLSGGEKQRVAIAAALVLQPRVLVLDEPTSQLDPQSAEDVLRALVSLNRELGLTVVLAEHRLERILHHADRLVYVPGDGDPVVSGPPREVLQEMDLTPPVVALGKALGWEPLPLGVEEAAVAMGHSDRVVPTGTAGVLARPRLRLTGDACAPSGHEASILPGGADILSARASDLSPGVNALGCEMMSTRGQNVRAPRETVPEPRGGEGRERGNSRDWQGIACAVPDPHPSPLPTREREQTSSATEHTPVVKGAGGLGPSSYPPAPRALLEVRGLRFAYGPTPILDGLGFSLAEGELAALMGPNGSGKTTLLRCVVGLLRPQAGSAILAGEPILGRETADICRAIGYLPQAPDDLLFAPTVADELRATLRNHGLAHDSQPAIDRLLGRLGLADLADAYPRDLSVGQRQRVAFGAIAVTHPRLLLLDEPTRGMDYAAKRELAGLLREWKAEGAGVLLVTHDVELVAEVADRVLVMSEGRLVKDGRPPEVLTSSDDLFAPQIARLFPGTGWLTVADALAGLHDQEVTP